MAVLLAIQPWPFFFGTDAAHQPSWTQPARISMLDDLRNAIARRLTHLGRRVATDPG